MVDRVDAQIMTPHELLEPLLGKPGADWLFHSLPEGNACAWKPTHPLPDDPAWYEALVERFYPAYWDWCQTAGLQPLGEDKKACEEFGVWVKTENCLVSTLRGLLSEDGRTFGALLRIAEWASRHPEESYTGINPLAGISCYLWRCLPDGYAARDLFERFERLMENGALAHNAQMCRNSIWKRFPDLVSRYGNKPPPAEPAGSGG
jgi:hypothetical protein